MPQTAASPDSPTSPNTGWRTLFGTEPPRSAALVAQAVAWQQQVAAHGDVSTAVRRDLAIAADQARSLRRGVHAAGAAMAAADPPASGAMLPPASSQLVVGARLAKAYGGRTHVVEVAATGMLYEGQLYASLSAVAKAITGTHWNGLLFFGLRKRRTYPAKAQAHG